MTAHKFRVHFEGGEPKWEPTDQADLLSLVSIGSPSLPTPDEEWAEFVRCLRHAADEDGRISPNSLRPLVRGVIAPRRVGAFTHRALTRGLVTYTGEYEVSNDHEGKNGGKPCRVMRWVGEQS